MFKKVLFLYVAFMLIGYGVAQGQSFGKNKVRYKGFTWEILKTSHFEIYYTPEIKDLARVTSSVAEDAYSRISHDLRHKVSSPIPLIIFKSHYDFEQTNIILELIEREVGGFAEVFKNRIVIPFSGSYSRMKEVIFHELTHIFQFDILYPNLLRSIFSNQFIRTPPLWLMEGLAEYERGDLDSMEEAILCDATINNCLIPICELDNFQERIGLCYIQSHSIIKYIADTFGKDKIGLLLKNFRSYQSADSMIKATLKMDILELEKGWIDWVKKRYYPKIKECDLPISIGRRLTEGIHPVWSKGDGLIALLNNKSGYFDVILVKAENGEVIEVVTKGLRFKEFEEISISERILCLSRDGRYLAFIAKKRNRDIIYIWDMVNSHITERLDVKELDFITSICFSQDGRTIGIAGSKNGRCNIYILDLKTRDLNRVTSGLSCTQPVFSHDGEGIFFVKEEDDFKNIYFINLKTKEIEGLILNQGRNIDLTLSPDGDYILFSSDRSGTYDLYAFNLAKKDLFKITNCLGGAFHPQVSHDGKRIAFTSYYKGGYSIYIMDFPKSKEEILAEKVTYERQETKEKKQEFPKAEVKEYKTKFSFDWISGGLLYSTSTGFSASTELALSDILGDHRFILLTDYLSVVSRASTLNFYLTYHYLAKRTPIYIGIYNWKDYYLYSGKRYIREIYGGSIGTDYPIDKFRRIELYYLYRVENLGEIDNPEKERYNLIGTSFVKDTTLWGRFGPLSGERRRITIEKTVSHDGLDFTNLKMDLRRYWKLGRDSNLALRGLFEGSFGHDKMEFPLGGITRLRGYYYGDKDLWKERIALVSGETRFTLIRRIDFSFPTHFSVKDIRSILFIDLGLGWDEHDKPHLGNFTRLEDLTNPSDSVQLCDFGIGFRALLGILPLKIDYIWRTDLKETKSALIRVSLGYDF
ncbi:MAG: peptidase MA family metallohydrolase [bacterium]|nr:peptidase MA family metallohydrolase [bacterium]